MSQRIYIKDLNKIIIESIGSTTQDDDIWYVTALFSGNVEIGSIKFTYEVKELVIQLERLGWKKEGMGEEKPETT